jgi:hypothetical protein
VYFVACEKTLAILGPARSLAKDCYTMRKEVVPSFSVNKKSLIGTTTKGEKVTSKTSIRYLQRFFSSRLGAPVPH